jgi:uncharacterized protein (DUF362 family)
MKEFKLTRIKRHYPDNSLKDVGKTCRDELKKFVGLIKEDSNIAIGVGSRGVDNIQLIAKEVVDFVKSQNANPFIIPAMGSHGGATAEGQIEILNSYGITERNVGAPIRSSMEVVELPNNGVPNPVFMGKDAFESDGVILINKIKPHTDFHSTYESGLVKMSVIGLGKELGAASMHHYGVFGLTNLIPEVAKVIFGTGKILGGIALIENANDKTMLLQAIEGLEFMPIEPGLLDIARSNMPALPVDKIDVLLIDRMGKNLSGAGIDTNIIGRIKIFGQPEPEKPDIRSIVVSDLTEESHGNAIGIGLADVITKRLFDKINFEVTNKNVATSSFLERGKIPIVAENDKSALLLALRNCGLVEEGAERIIRIKDTLHLDELYVSNTVLEELKDDPLIELEPVKTDIFNDLNFYNPF